MSPTQVLLLKLLAQQHVMAPTSGNLLKLAAYHAAVGGAK